MKKIFLGLVFVAAAALFSSCNLKSCYCCEIVGNTVTEVETATGSTTACASLNSYNRTCLEAGERIPGCNGVAIGYKAKKH